MTKDLLKYIKQLHPVVLDTESKFMFFGIRKAGLHSVYRYLLKYRSITRRDCRILWDHRITITDIDEIFKFTIIRNPWDRVVSAFHALQQARRPRIDKGINFRHFIKTTFKDKGISCDPHFEFQHPKFYFNGNIFVDYVARMENIKEDWRKIASIINCPDTLPHKYKSNRGPYRSYYDDECKEIVQNIYQKDIDLFEYKF